MKKGFAIGLILVLLLASAVLAEEAADQAGPVFSVASVKNAKMLWSMACTFFTRETADTYVPAELTADPSPWAFSGYWKSAFADVNGTAYAASALKDETDLRVNGAGAVLGGPVFNGVQMAMASADGALIFRDEAASVRLEIQQDGFLRMTVSFDEDEMIWYLQKESGSPLEEFIVRCYQNALGRTGEEPEIAYWADMVRNGEQTPAQIVQGILGSAEFQSKQLGNEELVSTLYRIYFNREADEAGLAAWTGMLNNGESMETIEEGFANSDEFKAILEAMGE